MSTERRKLTRHAIDYPAKIVANDGSWGRNCHVSDVSDSGAKLTTEHPIELPKDFILALAMHGHAIRHCHVVWSHDCEIGVKFAPHVVT